MPSGLEDCVCIVTGATRGIGKGIAIELGAAKATVYITGRTLKSSTSDVGGSLEETADAIRKAGGNPIPVVVDHTQEAEVVELFNRVQREQKGRLDLLVNNAYSAVSFLLSNLGKPFYKIDGHTPGEVWDIVNNVGLRNHYICSTLATQMMINHQKDMSQSSPHRPGLIINVSSWGAETYLFSVAYGAGKCALDRMAKDMAYELNRNKINVSVLNLWPGLVRTEHILACRSLAGDGSNEFNLEKSESPQLSGRVVVALATEPTEQLMARSGQVCVVSDVAKQHGIQDNDP